MNKRTILVGFLVALFPFWGLGRALAAKLYVTNISDNSLSVIDANGKDPKSWKVTKTVSVGKMPHVPVVSPDGKKLVFASNRHDAKPGETNVFIADWVP